jgi:hypothetical protein
MASTYLSKTPASATNRRTFTISFWLKTSVATGDYTLFYSAGSGSHEFKIAFDTSERLFIYDFNGTSFDMLLKTNRVFRDTSAFYNIVYEIDTTNATADDRIKLYVNGVQETSFSDRTNPSQNHDTEWNGTGVHYIGRDGSGAYIDGILTHIHNIDGTAYTASTFGETDATTGIWKPKTNPSVTYGTNGFFLKFENSGSMGTDSSGNANNFTVNGTLTQTVDTPSNVFATMNPLVPTGSLAFSNGNTTLTGSNDTLFASNNNSTLGVSAGKYYVEVEYDTAGGNTSPTVGVTPITTSATTNTTGSITDAVVIRMDNDLYVEGVTTSAYLGSTPVAGNIIGIALDMDNGKVWFSLNGTFVGDPVAGTGAAFDGITIGETMCFCTRALGAVFKWNFGNGYFGTTAVSSAQNPDDGIGIFEYDVPTGYRALCTKSINAEEYS